MVKFSCCFLLCIFVYYFVDFSISILTSILYIPLIFLFSLI